jgi:hypothetical protein
MRDHKSWAWLVAALICLSGGFLEIDHVAHQAKGAATASRTASRSAEGAASTARSASEEADKASAKADAATKATAKALRLDEELQAARRVQNQRDKAQINATAVIAKQRANDAAKSAAAVAALGHQNAQAIAELSTTQAQLNAEPRAICVGGKNLLRKVIAGLPGLPAAAVHVIVKQVDEQHCPSAKPTP